ncbi:hypothetical protein ACIRQF_36025 [Streptomyces sp. NPDC101191]|uniref:hypothetical protein n=1 Tax=Streptomyces sp. NPDC101191 TaxID=3366126 RepID=UPI00380277F4
MVRTRLKLAATLTVVVLALTGFQTSSGGGHGSGKSSSRSGKSKSGSGGGGCSSSKKKNDDYDDYDDSSGSGGSGSEDSAYTPVPTVSPSPAPDVEAFVVDCVRAAQKKRKGKPARKADTTTTVRVVSRTSYARTFKVVVEFEAAGGREVDRAEAVVSVDGDASKVVEIPMRAPGRVGQVERCEIEAVSVQ